MQMYPYMISLKWNVPKIYHSNLQSPSRTCPATKSVLPYIILPSIYDVMLLICSRDSRFAPWHTGNDLTNETHWFRLPDLWIGKHDLSKSPKHGEHLKYTGIDIWHLILKLIDIDYNNKIYKNVRKLKIVTIIIWYTKK